MLAQNKIVQYGSIGLLVVVVLVVVASGGSKMRTTEENIAVGGGDALTADSVAALGIEGDTEGDTVRTLIAEVKKLRNESDRLASENKTLRMNNSDLQQMEQRIGQGVEADLDATRERVNAQLDAKMQALDNQLRRLEGRARQAQQQTDSRVANTLAALDSASPAAANTGSGPITWVQPLGSAATVGAAGEDGTGKGGSLFGFLDTARNKADDKLQLERLTGRKSQRYGEAAQVASIRPTYTIPQNATLVNSTAMTALVGRVPLGSSVTDPYLFKVIIGRDNLAANGIEVPGVSYSIASGRAVGDWTLGCVRGNLYSMTFVFEDGTIRTVPKPGEIASGGGNNANETKIGELSDELGNPCVVGQRITNAYSYLAQRIGVVGAAAAAEAAAASQVTQTTSTGGGGVSTTSTVDGSTGDYVLGRTIADGTMEVARWLDERQAQQFDAVYVQPGASVALHITEQLEIDYDPAGRKTTYAGLGQGGYRALD
ncbi:MAG: TIGR03752 family integrating conjugative element protein [Parahaliea sp.]